MNKKSAGLVMYHVSERKLEVLLVHPGGPYWVDKDVGVWSIPKGEYFADEDPLEAAKREFAEEMGVEAQGEFKRLTAIRQKGGKLVSAWAVEGFMDVSAVRSNLFPMEWPPRSGKRQTFPEIDKAAWFPIEQAKVKIIEGQKALLEELQLLLT